jgi:hypothetical protein
MLGFPIDPTQEAALMRGMAVLQEHRFQNVSELYAALYGQQPGTPASATAQPIAAPIPHAPQQYQQTTHPSQQQYHQQPQQYQQHQPQPHQNYQHPQPLSQTPPEKSGFAGWLKRRKVPVIIGSVAVILLIILLPGLLSDEPANNNGGVTVTASPPPTAEPEPSPIRVSINGSWVSQVQGDYTTEFTFNDTTNRFYMVHLQSPDDNPENFTVVEGTFSISGDNIFLSSEWGAESNDDFIFPVGLNEQWNITFNLSGQTLTLYDEDGLPEVYTGGQTLGIWSFNHRETTMFTEVVEDMPYTVINAIASIPGYYTGFWSNNMPNGFGIFTNGESGTIDEHSHFNEGAFIIGTFVNGLVEGFAETGDPVNGDTFEGFHVNGLRSGFGVYTWGNGDVYEGYWENGRMSGEGTITYAEDGYSMEAFWVDGEPVGNVVITLEDGTIYDGVVENGELISLTER